MPILKEPSYLIFIVSNFLGTAHNILGKLERSDEERKTDYLAFLKAYFDSNCSINETADRLFLHRNTVVYKIKKINELLDCDLSDIDVRVKLYLASMLHNVL